MTEKERARALKMLPTAERKKYHARKKYARIWADEEPEKKAQPMTEENTQYRTFPGFGENHYAAQWARLLGLNRTTVHRYLKKGKSIEELARIKGISYPPGNAASAISPGRKEYEGFGMSCTAAEWARVLNLPANTVWRCLTAGETPEEIAARRGVIPGPNPKPRHRKGKRKDEVLRLMTTLLDRSDYDLEDLAVEYIPSGYPYKITRLGELIGVYSYQDDRLQFTNGDRLTLRGCIVPDATIERLPTGSWGLTIHTKKALMERRQAMCSE